MKKKILSKNEFNWRYCFSCNLTENYCNEAKNIKLAKVQKSKDKSTTNEIIN